MLRVCLHRRVLLNRVAHTLKMCMHFFHVFWHLSTISPSPVPHPRGPHIPHPRPGMAKHENQVVYSAMHGVGDAWAQRAFRCFSLPPFLSVGCQREPDPEFPTVAFPNPEEPGALKEAMNLAEAKGTCFSPGYSAFGKTSCWSVFFLCLFCLRGGCGGGCGVWGGGLVRAMLCVGEACVILTAYLRRGSGSGGL